MGLDWAWESLQDHQVPQGIVRLLGFLAAAVSPAQWCQVFYLAAAGCVLAVAATPAEARSLLINYGARKKGASPGSKSPPSDHDDDDSSRRRHKSPRREEQQQQQVTTTKKNGETKKIDNPFFLSLIATLTSWGQVPHSWFGVFYVVSASCSLFWLAQYLGGGGHGYGSVLQFIAARQARISGGPSATLQQVAVAWTMMLLQGVRRTYEHATIMNRPSKSTMWFVHWLLGLFFYTLTSMAVWVEGSGAILNRAQGLEMDSIEPLVKMSIAGPAFLFAWVSQYQCHKHLTELKRYSLPSQGLFQRLVCPHYTCECLLYLSIAVAAAPEGQWCNRTLLCAVFFVLVNLGVTASGTRKWYVDKFGAKAVADKWNMIPFIF